VDFENRERVIVAPKAGNAYANVRDKPNGADVDDLTGEEYAMRTVEAVPAGGLVWRHYCFEHERPDGLECMVTDGWMADSAVRVIAAPLPPEPGPEPPPPPEPEPLPEEPPGPEPGLALLEARVSALEAEVAELEAKIANHYRAGYIWLLEGAEAFGGTVAATDAVTPPQS